MMLNKLLFVSTKGDATKNNHLNVMYYRGGYQWKYQNLSEDY